MTCKLLCFPKTKGGVAAPKRQTHVIRRRLDEMGKDIKWLAERMEVTPQTLYNTMNYRTELKQIHFSRMLKVLGISENYYYGVGQPTHSIRTVRESRRTFNLNNGRV